MVVLLVLVLVVAMVIPVRAGGGVQLHVGGTPVSFRQLRLCDSVQFDINEDGCLAGQPVMRGRVTDLYCSYVIAHAVGQQTTMVIRHDGRTLERYPTRVRYASEEAYGTYSRSRGPVPAGRWTCSLSGPSGPLGQASAVLEP